MNRLYIEDDAGNVEVVPLEDVVTLGRSEDNDIVLGERNISRHHARIVRRNEQFSVEDAGSRYGLRVNGARVEGERRINPGDVIGVGDYIVKVLARDNAVAEGSTKEDEVPPDRRETVTGQPAIDDVEPPAEAPTGLMTVQEMEEIASQGWESDFGRLDEGKEKRKNTVGLLLMVMLLVVAVALGMTYFWASSDSNIESAEGTVPAVARAPDPEPKTAEKIDEQTAAASPETTYDPDESEKLPEEKPVKEKAVSKESVTKPSASKPKSVAKIENRPREPSGTPSKALKVKKHGDTDAMYAMIDAALLDHRAADAEKLLIKCTGRGCFGRWKKLAKTWEGFGEPAKAIAVYKRLILMTRDPTNKQRIRKRIEALGGTVD